VVKEIESWYLAGLDDDASSFLGLPAFSATDTVTKEDFNELIPEKFDSRIDFMMEMLKYFLPGVAVGKNRSFAYFIHKHHLEKSIIGSDQRRGL